MITVAADRRIRWKTLPSQIMGTKAERRAARDRVSAYHQAQLAGLLSYVAAAIDRYRDGELDACTVDETIHHYHRAAGELWKFCFSRGEGTTPNSSPASSMTLPPTHNPLTGGNAPHRDDASDHGPCRFGRALGGVPRPSRTVATPHHDRARRPAVRGGGSGWASRALRWA